MYRTKTCKGLEDFADNAAVAGPHEVKVHAGEEGGDPTIQGPCNKLAGKEFEEEQLCLGVFTGFDDSVKEDFIAMGLKQICSRSRLKELQVSQLISAQPAKTTGEKKAKTEVKMLRAKHKSAELAAWRTKTRNHMEKDGLSRAEVMEQMVPRVGKSPSLRTKLGGVVKKVSCVLMCNAVSYVFHDFHMVFMIFMICVIFLTEAPIRFPLFSGVY